MAMDFQGRVALVTGSSSGIGAATAKELAAGGAKVAVHYRGNSDGAAAVVAAIEAAGGAAKMYQADVANVEAATALIKQVQADLGGLDILVNNAGFHYTKDGRGTIDGLEPELVDRVIHTNLTATLWLTQAALPHLGPGSSIINTSSIQAYDPSGHMVDYAGTKAAINSITANLAQQLGPRGIRVNAVAPGPIWTPLQPATRSADEVSRFGSNSPLGRAGQPAEVAPAYVYLASPLEASYVSGSIVGVTGGLPTF